MIIVMGILTYALIGISALLLQNMQVESLTKNYVVASMLAQEGAELVRNIRDENWVLRDDWLDDIPDGTFAIDYRGRASVDTGPDTVSHADAKLFSNGAGFYSHVSSPRGTPFSRLITVDAYDDYILLTVDVMWASRFGERHYLIDTTLFNWRG